LVDLFLLFLNKTTTTRKGGQQKQSTMLEKLLNRDVPIRKPIIQPENANETREKSCAQNQMPHTETNSTCTHT